MGLQLQNNEPTQAGPPPLPVQAPMPQPVVPKHRQAPPPPLEPAEPHWLVKGLVWLVAIVLIGGGAVVWNVLVDAGAYAFSEMATYDDTAMDDLYLDDPYWGDGSAMDASIPGGRSLPAGWPQLRFSGVFKSGNGKVAGIVIDDSLVSVHGSVQGVKVLDVRDGWALLEYKGVKHRMEVWGE